MKKTALLVLLVLAFVGRTFAAPPEKAKIDLGGKTFLHVEKGTTTFTISFEAGKKRLTSKTYGDPMVVWRGRYIYWPSTFVVYVFPKTGTRVYGFASKKNGYCQELAVERLGRLTRTVFYDWQLKYDKKFNCKVMKNIVWEYGAKNRRTLKDYHRDFKKAHRIIFVGGKIGWKVTTWRGHPIKPQWKVAPTITRTASRRTVPVRRIDTTGRSIPGPHGGG